MWQNGFTPAATATATATVTETMVCKDAGLLSLNGVPSEEIERGTELSAPEKFRPSTCFSRFGLSLINGRVEEEIGVMCFLL